MYQNRFNTNFQEVLYMMNDLGTKLKTLRKKYDLTQEQLAERLGVSYQAVSKWETNAAVPDISMFPILANFYQVTTDELLGVDITKANDKINEYIKQIYQLHHEWKLIEAVELARKACTEFPGSDDLRFMLAHCLHQAQNVFRTKAENLNEASEILIKILETSTDTGRRLSCTSKLAMFAHNLGDDDKALEYARTLPTLFQTRQYTIGRWGLYKGDDRVSYARACIDLYFQAMRYVVEDIANAEDTSLTLSERIKLLDDFLALQTTIYGDNLCDKNFESVVYSYTKAELYCKLDDPDKAIECLEQALVFAQRFADYDESTTYTSAMQKDCEVLPRSHWSHSAFASLYDEFFESGKDKYTLLRGHQRFDLICDRVKQRV